MKPCKDQSIRVTPIARILSLMGLCAAAAWAVADEPGLPLWEVGIGAAAYHQPNYPGSDVRSTTAFPFPYVIYRGDFFRIDRNLQGILYETQRLKVDFSAGATSLVESDKSDARAGMPDLDPTIEVGPAVSLLLSDPDRPDNLWGRLAVRKAYSVDTGDWDFTPQGWIFDAKLRYQRPLIGETLRLSTEIGASFADSDYLGYFYDVPSRYSTPERPAFGSGSGYAGARLGLGLNGALGQWRWSVYGAYLNLGGAAFTGSPLLESRHDFSVGATLAWMFWRSERRVLPKNTSPGSEFDAPLIGF
jgi:outer membrane scaffolding protein for murein synthesis (MipA/OmpV family)